MPRKIRKEAGLLTALRERLRHLRLQHGFTQLDLARKSGVPQPTISRVEAGKAHDVRGETLRRLAEALGVTVDYLTGGTLLPTANDISRENPFVREIVATLAGWDVVRRERLLSFVRFEEEQRRQDEARPMESRRKRRIKRDVPKPDHRGGGVSASAVPAPPPKITRNIKVMKPEYLRPHAADQPGGDEEKKK